MSAELIRSPQSAPVSAADISAAAERIAPVVMRSPLQYSDRLSEVTGARVYLKREDLQSVRSYKIRGAYNLLSQLSADQLAAGVVCSSAGNHAQGFALACRLLGVRGRVYVPGKTPKQKRDRIRYHGGDFIELIVGGRSYDEAAMAALVAAVRSGTRLDDGPWLCRATLAAILGRQALEAGTAISWSDENAGPPAPARSLQSV